MRFYDFDIGPHVEDGKEYHAVWATDEHGAHLSRHPIFFSSVMSIVEVGIEELTAQVDAEDRFSRASSQTERLAIVQSEIERLRDALILDKSYSRTIPFEIRDGLDRRYHQMVNMERRMRHGWDVDKLVSYSVICPECGKRYQLRQRAWQRRHAAKHAGTSEHEVFMLELREGRCNG